MCASADEPLAFPCPCCAAGRAERKEARVIDALSDLLRANLAKETIERVEKTLAERRAAEDALWRRALGLLS